MANQPLFDFLQNVKKEKDMIVCFAIPSGIISGKFDNYDPSTQIITVLDSSFSNVLLDMEIHVHIDTIQAWGRK